MKNLKKVLAMVLAFACTFSMFAGAKVFEDVPAGSDYSEAITMLSDLGVIQGKDDGKYHPEDTITRAEACAMIARLMTGDPNVNGYTGAQNFTDVVKGSWQDSAIGYCFINGIVIGDGNGKFRPSAPITDAEFITMMVRAMGYETADMKQYYPHSYISAATSVGLLDGVTMVANSEALRGEDAQVIYNALFVDYARGAKMVNTTHGTSVETYPTLAESVWKLSRAAVGTWNDKKDEDPTLTNCKAHTWVVVGADKANEGNILAYPIDDDTTDLYESEKGSSKKDYNVFSFKYEGDVESIKGYQVELWGEGSHGEPTWDKSDNAYVYSEDWKIRAIKTVKGQTAYDYNASQADSKSDNGTIELGETSLDLDSVAKNAGNVQLGDATNTTVVQYLNDDYNGVKINGKDADKLVEKALNVRDGAQYKLMDWDSDGDVDWVVVSEANYYKVDSVTSKRLSLASMEATNKEETETKSRTTTWKLDELNDEKNYKIKVEAPEGLEEGDIVEVTYKTAYDKKEKAEVVTATITTVDAENHELDKVSTKNDMVLTFDGETMQLAENQEEGDTVVPANPTKYADFDEEELGTEFAIWQNRNGFIVYSDYANDTTNYMMVLDTGDGSDQVGDRKLAKIDMMTASGKVEKDVELTSDVRILKADDTSMVGSGGTKAYDDDTRKFTEKNIVGNVYKYWTNEDGQITKMQEMISDPDMAGSSTYKYASKNDRLTITGGESYALEDAKVIFAVKQDSVKGSYIQNDGTGDLKVDSNDVLAVKQSDIPNIGASAGDEDTDATMMVQDTANQNAGSETWIGWDNVYLALEADKNKDVSAAVLGVNNFNKFSAGSTKVALVTNVSLDKGGVVSADVAYNGEVTTLSSAEKSDMDDIVSAFEYKSTGNSVTHPIKSRDEKVNAANDVFGGESIRDYLDDGAAYAEVTVDADGKLTDLVFMDQGDDNTEVIGNYYQVSRGVVTDARDGFISINKGAKWADSNKKLMTVDTKNNQVANDYASDAVFYTIDGLPTDIGGYSANKAMTIMGGFASMDDINAAEKSDVTASIINEHADKADDEYYVADVASKIDDNGEGDAVAVFAYADDLGEVIAQTESGVVTLDTTTVQNGGKAKVTVNTSALSNSANWDIDSLSIVVTDDSNSKNTKTFTGIQNGVNELDLTGLPNGTYSVSLYGYNNVNEAEMLIEKMASALKIAAQEGSASELTIVDENGDAVAGADSSGKVLFFKANGKLDPAQVKVYRGVALEADARVDETLTKNVYQVTLSQNISTDKITIKYGDVTVETKGAASAITATDPVAMDLLNLADVEVDVSATGAVAVDKITVDGNQAVGSGNASGENLEATYVNGKLTIKASAATKDGTYKATLKAGTVTKDVTLTINKATKPTLGTVDVKSGGKTITVDITGYNSLSEGMKAEIAKKENWTVDQSGNKAIKSVEVSGESLTITMDDSVTLANGTQVDVTFGTTLNTAGKIDGAATASDSDGAPA